MTPTALGELPPSTPLLTCLYLCSRWSCYLESPPLLLHLPTSTVHQSPQLNCPSPREPGPPAHQQAEQTAVSWGPHSFDRILYERLFPSLSSSSTCWPSQWECRLSGGHDCAEGVTQRSKGTQDSKSKTWVLPSTGS